MKAIIQRRNQAALFLAIGLLVFQNCAPTKFNQGNNMQASGNPDPCANPEVLCVGTHRIRSVNGILASLGSFEVWQGPGSGPAGVDAQGFLHVTILNPLSGRHGYLMIKYVDNKLTAKIDPTRSTTQYPWVCLDHQQSPTAMIGGNPNCWSPIRVFDEDTVVDVGASAAGIPVAPAYKPEENYRVEIPFMNDPTALLVSQGCQCRLASPWLTTLTGQGFFPSLTSANWLRVSAMPSDCSVLSSKPDYSKYFSQCYVDANP